VNKLAVLAIALLTACASKPEGPATPAWDAIPAGVAEALCLRLQHDAFATGTVTVVRVTQPLATPESVAAVEHVTKHGTRGKPQPISNRAIPVLLGRGTCSWTPIDVRDMPAHADEMIVELSAPLANPWKAREAGMFARVSLSGEHQSWYWIPLLHRGDNWAAGLISVLPK
jgi:hypothetical protein